jgi:hypothetical protein
MTFGSRSIGMTFSGLNVHVRQPGGSPESSGRLRFALDLQRMIANQAQNRLHAFATLGATAAGLVNVPRPTAARIGDSLFHSFIGQRIAQADIHGCDPSIGGSSYIDVANASQ